MKKQKFLVLSLLLLMSNAITSCGKTSNSSSLSNNVSTSSSSIGSISNTSSSTTSETKTFNISVVSIALQKMQNIAIEIYKDNVRLRSLLTDDTGSVSVSLVDDNYDIKLKNVPDGYYLEKEVKLEKGKYEYEFVLYSKVIEKEIPEEKYYQLGDIIYDFTVKDSTGVNFNLSESLKTHDAVMINFWNTNCYWCAEEFPVMEEVYQEFKDDIEIIAMSNYDTDSDINEWKNEFGLSFPMAFDSNQVWSNFGVNEFPTTIMIDRYGIISYGQAGAFTSKEELVDLFNCFVGDDYVPYISKDAEEVDRTPTVSMPSSSEIERVINGEGVNCTYRISDKESDVAFMWPWIISEDGMSIKASNSKVDATASTIMTDIVIPEGKALAFDYLSLSEKGYDILYVFVDDLIIHQISGVESEWKTCYAYVSEETRSYNISLYYVKDYEGYASEDTVYVNNMRFVDAEDINTPTYIFRSCSEKLIEETWNYEEYSTVVYNEEDGFFHIDDVNGPLVLADLIYETHWSKELTPYIIATGNGATINKVNYTDTILEYVSYAGNGSIKYTPVTMELYEALKAITNKYGDPNNANEWLELCSYYSVYATDGKQFEDPTKGLATYNAYTAVLGDQNFALFDRPILPRGLKFKFVPETSGVYKVNSIGEEETVCWIMDENGEIIAENNFFARKFAAPGANSVNFEMYYYFEAGETYFINPAFYDYLYDGLLQFNLEYVGETYDLFTRCSPGYYTTGLDEYGEMTDEIISPGVSYTRGDDGYYYVVEEDGTIGSMIYVDFVYVNFINMSLADAITYNGFVLNGEDLSLKARQYYAKAETDKTKETYGCTPVDDGLKTLLEKFMNVYGFEGVEHQWLKLCYYYQHFGA